MELGDTEFGVFSPPSGGSMTLFFGRSSCTYGGKRGSQGAYGGNCPSIEAPADAIRCSVRQRL